MEVFSGAITNLLKRCTVFGLVGIQCNAHDWTRFHGGNEISMLYCYGYFKCKMYVAMVTGIILCYSISGQLVQ